MDWYRELLLVKLVHICSEIADGVKEMVTFIQNLFGAASEIVI